MFEVGRLFQSIKNLDKTPLGFYLQFSIPSLSTLRISRANAPTIVPTSLTTPGLNPEGSPSLPDIAGTTRT